MTFIVTCQVVIVAVFIAGIIISDIVFLVVENEPETLPPGFSTDTYSEVTRQLGHMAPIAPWLWGMIAGRVFHWGQTPVIDTPGWLNLVILLAGSALILTLFTVFNETVWKPIARPVGMSLAFFLGYVSGGLFWPENVARISFI